MARRSFIIGAGIGLGMAASLLVKRRRIISLRDKTVFVTGGSRGLGLLLAQEFAKRGAKIAISARDRSELERAEIQLREITDRVLTLEVDMTMREEVETAIQNIQQHFGSLDILVNNAGIICVGPVETMTIDDYRDSINTHFWGPYFATMAVLPLFQRRRTGRIVNISSIGGKISVPHLVPYSVGKFALTGFSEGLRSELLKDNIYVTTVCPGLMRTGSPRNASFKGNNEAEYAWFSISDALPAISMSARRAARQIVNACICGDAEVVLSVPAKVAVKLHSLLPGLATDLLGLINVLLPPPGGIGSGVRTGKESTSSVSPSWITTLNERAAQENNQVP
jgi:NAD(P)-dependent dehydrogenase (short-subunit alcohol dehydrogenase family)